MNDNESLKMTTKQLVAPWIIVFVGLFIMYFVSIFLINDGFWKPMIGFTGGIITASGVYFLFVPVENKEDETKD